MNHLHTLSLLCLEMGKFILRGEEKNEPLTNGAIEFINFYKNFFINAEECITYIQNQSNFTLNGLFPEQEEPFYSPLQIKNNSGFPIYIFKGEQDIAPLALDQITIGARQYQKILHSLRHDLRRLQTPPTISIWFYLLKRYGKWVPASAHHPKISLYDYTRVKLALSVLLAKEMAVESHSVVLFSLQLNGAISFHYDPHYHPDIDTIKEQLYQLQILREYIADTLLANVGLPCCNCTIQEGNFIQLLIATDQQKKLATKCKEIEDTLLKKYQGKLSLAYDYTPIPLTALNQQGFLDIWSNVEAQLCAKSYQKFANALTSFSDDKYKEIFSPFGKSQQIYAKDAKLLENLTKANWITKCKDNIQHHQQKPDPDAQTQLYRFGNTDFACISGAGFKFSETIPYLNPCQSCKNSWAIFSIYIYPKNRADHYLDFITVKETIMNFHCTSLAALLREKRYRKQSYLVHLYKEIIYGVVAPEIILTLVEEIYKILLEFTQNQFYITGYIDFFSGQYPIAQALYKHRQKITDPYDSKITINDEKLEWSYLTQVIEIQQELKILSKLKGKKHLFKLWDIAQSYCLRQKTQTSYDISWNNLINYYCDNIELDRAVSKKFVTNEEGGKCLYLALTWNHLLAMVE